MSTRRCHSVLCTQVVRVCVCAGLLFVCRLSVAQLPPNPDQPLNEKLATHVTIRVVGHGSLALGREVGGAKVTITDLETGQLLATGLQQGEAGDQNLIMRTPHVMREPVYSSAPSAAFTTTLYLDAPTRVEIAAQGPMGYPISAQRVAHTTWLIPGQHMSGDGVVLELYGYLVRIEAPPEGESLIAKEDVTLRASVRTLAGTPVQPHGDWDARSVSIFGEVMIGGRVIERLQMFFSGERSVFEAPFFVPTAHDAPDGITLRVVAANAADGNVGVAEANYPVLTERLRPNNR
ncbi:hypothetical protein YTPLAS18_24810 [Nitrospira sp.]|nr:hypothetical protein YTPLAS18_24810 [Nitrospira sp.]